MRKLLSAVCVAALALTLFALPCVAADATPEVAAANEELTGMIPLPPEPADVFGVARYTHINTIGAGLTINNGLANYSGWVEPHSNDGNTYYCTATIELLKYDNGQWNVVSGSAIYGTCYTSVGEAAGASKSGLSVERGYNYMARTTGTAKPTNGSTETQYAYSDQVYAKF